MQVSIKKKQEGPYSYYQINWTSELGILSGTLRNDNGTYLPRKHSNPKWVHTNHNTAKYMKQKVIELVEKQTHSHLVLKTSIPLSQQLIE